MMRSYFLYLLFITSLFSCGKFYHPESVTYKDYRIGTQGDKDSSLNALLTPYSDSVNSIMNKVVGYVDKDLNKSKPEGELGNFMADALLEMGRIKFGYSVDIAMINYGGVRLNQLSKGDITRSKIFELMPFENLLIVQKLTGSQLQKLLDGIAATGGWPVAGLTMEIKDKKAVNVFIGGKRLEQSSVYTVLNSDYVAKGGDGMGVLKELPYEDKGYLMRDALFDYIDWLKKQGRNISANIENRVVYVD